MKTILGQITIAVFLVAAGCRTAPSPGVTPSSSASGVGTNAAVTLAPESSTPRKVDSLAQAIEFSEEMKGSRRLAIPEGAHLADLDYKSQLTIRPRKQGLEILSAPGGRVLPALDDENELRLEQLPTLIQAASNYVSKAQRINEEVRGARASGNLSAEQIAALQNRIRAQANLGQQLIGLIIKLAEAKAKARLGAGAGEDQVVAEVKRLTDPLLVDSQGNGVTLNVKAFGRFLTEEMQFGIAVATNDVATVEREGTTRLRIRAWVISGGKEPLAAHVENYDDIEDPMPPKTPRVSFRMDENERERVDRGYRVAGDAARLIQDMKSSESSLRQGLSALLQTTHTDLKSLRNDLARIDSTTSSLVPPPLVAVLSNAVAVVTNSAGVDEKTKQEVAALPAGLESISQQRSNLLVLTELAGQPSSEDLVQTFSVVSVALDSAVTSLVSLPATLQTNLSRLSSLAGALREVKGPEAANLATSLTATLLPQTTRKWTELEDLFNNSFPNLAAELADVATRVPTMALAGEVNAAHIDPRVKALALDQIVPGTVNLDNLPADHGDKLRVKSELIIPSGGQERTIESDKTFAIDRFGWTSGFSAHLAFVGRQGSGGDFVPAPSVSWTLHYRLRERQQTGWGEKVWSFLDPGVGVNVAALSFDNNFEVGVGGHLTLFSDLLEGGYGYDLNVSRDHGYVFVGIGILEALQGVGNLFQQARADVSKP